MSAAVSRLRPGRRCPTCLFAALTGLVLLAGPGLAADPNAAPAPRAEVQSVDLLVAGARVVDGTGAAAREADVAIEDGRIVAVGPRLDRPARRTLDARGLVLAPGFVDLHSHGDWDVLRLPDAENVVRQGCTTIVGGNCGSSHVDFGAFRRKLHETGIAVHVVLQIGHGSVRRAVLGDQDVQPDADQIRKMQRLVRRALEDGAVGLSSGLAYRPGAWARTDEVAACTIPVGPAGGFYATHMRDEGNRILEAIAEASTIAERGGVPLHVSHHKTSACPAWGDSKLTLAWIDAERAKGRDVSLDQYPYGAGSSQLSLMVPQSDLSGGFAGFRARIRDPDKKAAIVVAVERNVASKLFERGRDPQSPGDVREAFTRIRIARLSDPSAKPVGTPRTDPAPKTDPPPRAAHEAIEGKHLTRILDDRQVPVTLRSGAELIVELVAREARAVYHTIDDSPGGDVDRILKHPRTCVASDGVLLRPGEGQPHPRSYGTYPRLLGHYVRERQVIILEDAVRKATGLPAERLGWTDRGLVRVGYWADLVLFDPATIRDVATFDDPHRYAEGVRHVLVEGRFVLEDGRVTDARPGRPLSSVPVAKTTYQRVRRAVLDELARYDGRCALFAIRTTKDGRAPASDENAAVVPSAREFAFDAHEPFDLPAIRLKDGAVVAQAGQAGLRDVVRGFAKTESPKAPGDAGTTLSAAGTATSEQRGTVRVQLARRLSQDGSTMTLGLVTTTTAGGRPVASRFDPAASADPPPGTVPDPDTFDFVRRQLEQFFASNEPFR